MNRKVSETKIFRNMMEDYFESHGFIQIDKNLYVKHVNDEIRASISLNSGTKVPGLLWFRVSAANANAEAYGISSLKKYGDSLYQSAGNFRSNFSHLSISLGDAVGWANRGGIYLPEVGHMEALTMLDRGLRAYFFPLLSEVTTCRSLLQLLWRDEYPYEWYKSNAALRIANIAYLSYRTGEAASDTMERAAKYESELLRCRLLVDPHAYIQLVFDEASAV
ncbi:hypothetical protein [Pseudoxanthobacter sp. M-2]|uniref:hypothetical protein n=1 Tax=Pseudoxanthobacter sp. M-2 TaxID=3078754 RepID=UPI0038FCD0DB